MRKSISVLLVLLMLFVAACDPETGKSDFKPDVIDGAVVSESTKLEGDSTDITLKAASPAGGETTLSIPSGITDGAESAIVAVKATKTEDALKETSSDGIVLGALDITLFINNNATAVTSFAEGKAITVKTTVAKGLTKDNIVIEHKDGNGTVTAYDAATGALTFTVSHLSEYKIVSKDAVVYDSKNGTFYTDLADAIKALDSITLLKDVVLTGGSDHYFDISKDMTLDLGDNTLTSKDLRIFMIKKGTLTLKNGTVEGNLTTYTSSVIRVTSESGDAGIVISKDAVIKAPNSFAVTAFGKTSNSGTISVYGTIESKNPCISGQGHSDYSSNKVTMNIYDGANLTKIGAPADGDGKVWDRTAVYQPNPGELNISGGTITCEDGTAVEIRAGKATVSGGKIKSNAETVTCDANGNGTTTKGSALAVAQHTTKKDITVNITGGTFEGYHAMSVMNPQGNALTDLKNVKVTVTGGSFTATGSDGKANVVNVDKYFAVSGNAKYDAEANFTVTAVETLSN